MEPCVYCAGCIIHIDAQLQEDFALSWFTVAPFTNIDWLKSHREYMYRPKLA